VDVFFIKLRSNYYCSIAYIFKPKRADTHKLIGKAERRHTNMNMSLSKEDQVILDSNTPRVYKARKKAERSFMSQKHIS